MKTHCAIGDLKGDTHVFFDMVGERSLYSNEEQHEEEHPYIQFVNARTFPEMMAALDRLHEDEYASPLFPSYGTFLRPEPTTDAWAIARLFSPKANWRQKDRIVETIPMWAFGNKAPDDVYQSLANYRSNMAKEWNKYHDDENQMSVDPLDNHWKPFLPLADIVQARNDLYLACRLLAWLMGKIPFHQAHGLGKPERSIPRHDRPKLQLINVNAKTALGDYYSSLASREQNRTALYLLDGGDIPLTHMNEYDESGIKNDVRQYVETAFSLLLSDVHQALVFDDDLQPRWISNNATLLSDMWSYLAEHICMTPGRGSVSVCRHCGNLFVQERKTKKFCSKSCVTQGAI